MSDMNFPSSPSDGDEYRKWVYDASSGSWVIIGGNKRLCGLCQATQLNVASKH